MTSPYPRDDFDAVTPPRDGRRGAHRAAPRRSSGLLATLVVAGVVAVAGGTAYAALSPTSGSTASASTAQDDAAAAAAAGGDDDDAASADGAAAAPSASAAPDQSAPVVVLNGTGTKGLAATTKTALEGEGWKVASTGNATTAQRSAHDGTTVLYPTAELEGPATALATSLQGSAALDAGAAAGSLTVVLLP